MSRAFCLFVVTMMCPLTMADDNVGYRIMEFPNGDKTLTVAVWYPTKDEPKPYKYGRTLATDAVRLDAEPLPGQKGRPFLAWSHGYGGGGIGSVFLAEAMAAKGWVVAACDHSDEDQAVRIRTGPQKIDGRAYLERAKKIADSADTFDRKFYAYRPQEMKIMIDGVISSKQFQDIIDPDKLAFGGHSFGGFTSVSLHLGLCGGHQKQAQALLLYSPGLYMFKPKEFAQVKIPTMHWLGTIEQYNKRSGRRWERLPRPRIKTGPAPSI